MTTTSAVLLGVVGSPIAIITLLVVGNVVRSGWRSLRYRGWYERTGR